MHVIGLDIGGANIKVAHVDGRCMQTSFPLWKSPEKLASKLKELLAEFPTVELLAITMTGELADCFRTKREGVEQILASVESAAGESEIAVWQTGSEFVDPPTARMIPQLVAASNWHALATWTGRWHPEGTILLIDVGTTTTDIVPIVNGKPAALGMTDFERLAEGELVYTGYRRTPVCAIQDSVVLRGKTVPLAAELFATTLDVFLLLEELEENPNNCDTANGKPATKTAAAERMARMLCCDTEELRADELIQIARSLADSQRKTIQSAMDRVLLKMESPCEKILLAGRGSFIVRQILTEPNRLKNIEFTDLCELMAEEISESACAYATAQLANERWV